MRSKAMLQSGNIDLLLPTPLHGLVLCFAFPALLLGGPSELQQLVREVALRFRHDVDALLLYVGEMTKPAKDLL